MSDLNASKLKVKASKGKRLLKFYCENCLTEVRLISNLNQKNDELVSEVEELKFVFKKNHLHLFTKKQSYMKYTRDTKNEYML